MTIPDRWLFPHDPAFSAASYLTASGSPRARDLAQFGAWIDDAAKQYNLNPRWLLMLAEKEQSFLSRRNDGSAGWKRAYNWTLGYGATDGGDLPDPGLVGPENQVYRAAKGLRRYLTPGDSLCVLGHVGHEQSGTQGRFTPRTIAEAAAWQYTPWVAYLADIISVWNALRATAPATWDAQAGGVAMPSLDLATTAETVMAARVRGDTETTLNGVTFNLETGGMCSRFVRQCHQAAGLPTDAFGCCAHTSGQHLKGAGKQLSTLVRGAVMVFSNSGPACGSCGQAVWHIGIYLGNGRVAENTSSSKRGEPRPAGTKISALSDIDPDGSRLWGLFGVTNIKPDAYRDRPITVKVLDTPYTGFLEGGTSYVGSTADAAPMPVRVLEKGGFVVYDHIPDENTVYVYLRGK